MDIEMLYILGLACTAVIFFYWYMLLPKKNETKQDEEDGLRLFTPPQVSETDFSLGAVRTARSLSIATFAITLGFCCLTAYGKLPKQNQEITQGHYKSIPCHFAPTRKEGTREEGRVIKFPVKVVNIGDSPNKEVYLTAVIGKELSEHWAVLNVQVDIWDGDTLRRITTKLKGYGSPESVQESSKKGAIQFYFRDSEIVNGSHLVVELYVHPRIINFETMECDPDANIADLEKLLKNLGGIPVSINLTSPW